ncbi:hypothetical protein SAMN04487969_13544 [Paenibacillus algorifonticola]|uniref:Uncharacterized protein n=1 Tax=Paenibacillus algorifonticola TaxID=684063 RepID=A0A1I2IFE1_9BACL|nr:hypothetical protein [Paenibacillus algorifonticola]SFF41112.1 hypothetical protein SAMN04487969_13544 [Paenibacillus algorifonticola]
MKEKSIKILGLFMILTLLLNLTPAYAAENAIEIKDPDAFNFELEKQKIQELSSTEEISFNPDEPLVINFDDGSSVTYSVNRQFSRAGSLTLSVIKSYDWLVGYAKIELSVSKIDYYSGGSFGEGYLLSGNSNDVYQTILDTGWATVSRGVTEAKHVTLDSGYKQGIKARGKGDITYYISGIYKQQSYEFIWQKHPTKPEFTFPSSY